MPSVKWSTIFPTVFVCKDILEILSQLVDNHHLLLSLLLKKIHAILTLVDPTAILQDRLEAGATALVSPRWLEHRPTADQSVLSIPIVHQRLHVSTENVKTPVLDCVEEMLTAELETMYQYVSAIRDSLEIHSLAATDLQQPHQDQKSLTPADQVHVALMLSAEREMELLLVPVFLVSLEIHMFNVSQSAQSIQNVPATRPVSIRNVLTLVQEFVEPMLLVQSRITILHAPVTQDILETHSDIAQE
jgi:hypothetical protein